MEGSHEPRLAGPGTFTTTHWSIVLAARDGGSGADGALESLCRIYWPPLYAFARRRGFGPPDAQDLTQEFFARFLEKNYLQSVDRGKGRFRSFLLACFEHFLAKEWRRASAQKRGGRVAFVSFADEALEQRYLEIPAGASPEQLFEKEWAMTLLDQVLAQLRDEYVAAGKDRLFDATKVFLTGEKRASSYAELAAGLATTEAALKMCVSRMRQRFGEVLRAEIAHTVASPEDVDDELRALFAALSGEG
jgi:RNA polymerase sigma-70 factor (ECF subfamily)